MSAHHEWGCARSGRYGVLTRSEVPEVWLDAELEASHVLAVFNVDGDGLILEGEPAEILQFVDELYEHAHRILATG